jgi:multiple sugar transport system substrate-binding protein
MTRRRALRFGALGALVVAATPLLAACQGAAPESKPAAPAPAPAAPAPAAPAPAAPAPAAPAAPAPAAPAAAKPAQAGPGGFSGGGSLKMLLNAHFVPAYDKWFDEWAQQWGKKNNVAVEVDHIQTAEFPTKIAAEVASDGGHDIIRLPRTGDAYLWDKYLVDVSDIAKPIGEEHGGWLPVTQDIAVVNGVWKMLPDHHTAFDGLYRKDIFEANNLKVPDTWDDLLKAGPTLKQKGNRIGIGINQKSTDSLNSWSSVLWGYGGSTVAADSKTVTINSPETRMMLEYAVELYNSSMTEEVLSWDESSNNQLLASGVGSWIHNPISALRTIEKQDKALADKIWITPTPGGPKGRFYTSSCFSDAIMTWSKNVPAAKAIKLDYYRDFATALKMAEGYNQPMLVNWRKKPMPVLGDDPKYQIDQDASNYYKASGYPGKPTQAAGEVEANWIVSLMVARAIQDKNYNGAMEWAEQRIKAIYDKYK